MMNKLLLVLAVIVLCSPVQAANFPPLVYNPSTGGVQNLPPGGVLIVPTAPSGTSTTQVATTAFVSLNAGANLTTANCANAAGDGAIINSALATDLRVHIVGQCDIDIPLNFTMPGQIIYGDGRTITRLNVSTILTTGSLIFNTGEPGPIIQDIGIAFSQNPSATTRSQLTNYTPAIHVTNAPRFKLTRDRISAAMVAIDGSGGMAGAVIDDLECSAFSICISADNTADSVKISNSHFWPFGSDATILSSTLQAIMYAPNTTCVPGTTSGTAGAIGIYSGRLDDLKVSNTLMLYGQDICTFTGTGSIPGPTFGELSNVGFDTFGGINMQSGQLSVVSSYFSLASAAYPSIIMSGGNLQLSSVNFQQGHTFATYPVISMSAGAISLNGIYVNAGAADIIFLEDTGTGAVNINGLQLASTLGTQTNPKIAISGTTIANISGVVPINPVTSANLINIGADNYHRIIGNGLNVGWVNACVVPTLGVYANNGTASAATCN